LRLRLKPETKATGKDTLVRIHLTGTLIAAGVLTSLAGGTTQAQQPYKIGISAGMTGYGATIDRAWRDGVELAAAGLNEHGGVLGQKIEVITEDNRSEPQDAVTVYRKMISSDQVKVFISGCVSAGNFAAAGIVIRAQIPMVLCSILPPQPDQVKWAFSLLPPPRFEVEKRYQYLQANTQIRTIGILHDPTPYATLQKNIGEKVAPDFGLTVAGIEQYKQDDADLSAQISKLKSQGAQAIVKMGQGGSTLTAAKNIKQLGLDIPLLASVDDLAIFKPAGDALGDKFLFVAAPSQVYEALPDGALKQELGKFLPGWRAKYGERDPNWGGKGWDGMLITAAAVQKANAIDGPKVRDSIETISGFQGTGGVYNFSPTMHQGITENPLVLGTISNGNVKVVK
jgi:ABC-type branched-subunit amino acid transport system substrate-binding protein